MAVMVGYKGKIFNNDIQVNLVPKEVISKVAAKKWL